MYRSKMQRETVSIKYTLKVNKSFATDLQRDTNYETLHNKARLYFETFIGTYLHAKSIEEKFISLHHFAELNKQRKKSLTVCLYYPKAYL